MSWREGYKKHWASFIFVKSFTATIKKPAELITASIFLLTLAVIFKSIWDAFGGNNLGAPSDSVWYFFLNELIALSSMYTARNMRRDNQQGLLISQFIRPIPVPLAYVVQGLGRSMARTVFFLLVLTPCLYLHMGQLPTSTSGFLFSACLVPLALIIDTLLQSAIGCLNLWMGDAQPLEWVYQKCAFLLGGMMVPLSFYPDALALIAKCTPFYWLMCGHARFVFGGTAEEMFTSFCFLLLWGVVGMGVTLLSYNMATRKLYFSGGVG
jgi:ABC-type uncharacterized transport system permease subunit